LGRNGYGHCVGITVYRLGDEIIFSPTNTRGVARCSISLPEAQIDELISALKNQSTTETDERTDKVKISCKNCNSQNTTVHDTVDFADRGYDAYVCRDCGHEGKVWYVVKYTEIE